MLQLTCTESKRMAEFNDSAVQCFKVTDKHHLPQSVFPKVEVNKPLDIALAWVYSGDLSGIK